MRGFSFPDEFTSMLRVGRDGTLVFFGLAMVAVTTGLIFARFSRATARVVFSKVAVVTKFEGVPTLMFRAAGYKNPAIPDDACDQARDRAADMTLGIDISVVEHGVPVAANTAAAVSTMAICTALTVIPAKLNVVKENTFL